MSETIHPAPAAEEGEHRYRTLVTPEGIDLSLPIATAGERTAALAIDLFAILSALIVMSLFFMLIGSVVQSYEFIVIVWTVIFFLLRNFYFTFFEMGPRAATPGKRAMGLRVMARDGGCLRGEAVFVRNAVRELELFLPLSFTAMSTEYIVDGWIGLVGGLWALVFTFFPLMNKDRLRLGDVAGGTLVVKVPKQVLAPDTLTLGADTENSRERQAFDTSQLDAYGVKELQVLEDVLRAPDENTIEMITQRIRKKISAPPQDDETDTEFLERYYAALRAHLEKKLLLGKRRRDKHDNA